MASLKFFAVLALLVVCCAVLGQAEDGHEPVIRAKRQWGWGGRGFGGGWGRGGWGGGWNRGWGGGWNRGWGGPGWGGYGWGK